MARIVDSSEGYVFITYKSVFGKNLFFTLCFLSLSFQMNISAIGFSPQPNTIPMLHDHNEYLNAAVYLKGIEIYEKIISNLANVWIRNRSWMKNIWTNKINYQNIMLHFVIIIASNGQIISWFMVEYLKWLIMSNEIFPFDSSIDKLTDGSRVPIFENDRVLISVYCTVPVFKAANFSVSLLISILRRIIPKINQFFVEILNFVVYCQIVYKVTK